MQLQLREHGQPGLCHTRHMKITSREKRFNSKSHCNLVHKFIPMPQARKIPDAKSNGGQIIGGARKATRMAKENGKGQKSGRSRSTKREKENPLCYIDGHVSSQECGVGTHGRKRNEFFVSLQYGAHIYPYASSNMKIPDAKAAVETWAKCGKILAWLLTIVRNKNEVIAEARNEGRTIHFAS